MSWPVPTTRLVTGGLIAASLPFVALAFPFLWAVVIIIDVVLVLTALIDLWITPGSDQIEAHRELPDRFSLLSEEPLRVHVRNRAGVTLWARIRDGRPATFQARQEEWAGELPPGKDVVWEYEARPTRRGLQIWGDIHIRYRSPLGLWEWSIRRGAKATSAVYPSAASVQRYHLLAKMNRLDILGIRMQKLQGGNAEFESLRDYTRGDDVRMIDWKASARRAKLIVQNQRVERSQTVIILVDCGRLMNAEIAGVSKLDHAVNTTLLLGHVALHRGDRVGVCAFSHKVHRWMVPRSDPGHNRLISEFLYDLSGDFTETDHGRCLRWLSLEYPKRSLVVVLTDFVDAATAQDMVANLRQLSRRHMVLFAAMKDPFLEAAAMSRVETTRAAFRKAAAVELVRERVVVLEQLRRMGIHALDVEPGKVTPPVINEYLQIAARGLV